MLHFLTFTKQHPTFQWCYFFLRFASFHTVHCLLEINIPSWESNSWTTRTTTTTTTTTTATTTTTTTTATTTTIQHQQQQQQQHQQKKTINNTIITYRAWFSSLVFLGDFIPKSPRVGSHMVLSHLATIRSVRMTTDDNSRLGVSVMLKESPQKSQKIPSDELRPEISEIVIVIFFADDPHHISCYPAFFPPCFLLISPTCGGVTSWTSWWSSHLSLDFCFFFRENFVTESLRFHGTISGFMVI